MLSLSKKKYIITLFLTFVFMASAIFCNVNGMQGEKNRALLFSLLSLFMIIFVFVCMLIVESQAEKIRELCFQCIYLPYGVTFKSTNVTIALVLAILAVLGNVASIIKGTKKKAEQ